MAKSALRGDSSRGISTGLGRANFIAPRGGVAISNNDVPHSLPGLGLPIIEEQPWSDTVTDLHVSQCRKWIFNPRHAVIEDRIPELAKLIRELGQLDPIIVSLAKDGSGMYDILCGQRRWMAIGTINHKNGIIKAKVVPPDMPFEVMMQLAVASQANTDPLRDIDYALTILELDREGRNPIMVLGKDKSSVSKLRQIGSLPPAILSLVKESPDKLTMNFCYELAQVCARGTDEHVKHAYDLAKTIVEDDLTLAEAVRASREILGSKEKTRRSWTNSSVRLDGKDVGMIKTREATGEITLSLKYVRPAGLERIRAFAAELIHDRELFGMTEAERNSGGA